MIFDEPVLADQSKGPGPKKYIPGTLLDKKDITMYQHKDNVMVIIDYDKKVDIDLTNQVLKKTLKGGAKRKEECVVAISGKKINKKMFRNIIDKILYSQDLAYDYMSSLPNNLKNNDINFSKEKIEDDIVKLHHSKYQEEGTLRWDLLSPVEQGVIIYEQFYHKDPELVAGKNIGPEEWIGENRKVWHIVQRASDEEREQWMKNFFDYKKKYDQFSASQNCIDGVGTNE